MLKVLCRDHRLGLPAVHQGLALVAEAAHSAAVAEEEEDGRIRTQLVLDCHGQHNFSHGSFHARLL